MANKKPRELNFDSELVDGRSVLQAYRTILGGGWVEPIYREERVTLRDVLKDELRPGWGFKK